MDNLLQAIITYFEDWLDVSDTGKGDLEGIVAELKTLTAAQPVTPHLLPAIEKWLPTAVQNESAPHCEPLMAELAAVYKELNWSVAKADYVGDDYTNRSGYSIIVGNPVRGDEGVLYPSEKVAVGFMLMSPDLFYPPHAHTAIEYYGILSGLSEWQIYYNRPVFHPPGAHIFHPSEAPHAMQTHDEPLLLVWAWTGDIKPPYSIETNGGWL